MRVVGSSNRCWVDDNPKVSSAFAVCLLPQDATMIIDVINPLSLARFTANPTTDSTRCRVPRVGGLGSR
jgi:hypothetical protein